MKSYTEIEEMILNHIDDIDEDIKQAKSNVNFGISTYSELYKAKSLALQALADLKNGHTQF